MREVNPVFIRLYYHQNVEAMKQGHYASCRKDGRVRMPGLAINFWRGVAPASKNNFVMAFARPPKPWKNDLWCEVHMILNEWPPVPHEIKHCIHGFWNEHNLDYVPKVVKAGN